MTIIFRNSKRNLLSFGFDSLCDFLVFERNKQQKTDSSRKIISFLLKKAKNLQYYGFFKLRAWQQRAFLLENLIFLIFDKLAKTKKHLFFEKMEQLKLATPLNLLEKVVPDIEKLIVSVKRKILIRKTFEKLNKTRIFCKKCDKLCSLMKKYGKIRISREFLENLKKLCSEQIKEDHKKTLKTLGFNKILFIIFEIFQKRLKTAFFEFKKPRRHEKKTSLRDIMETMETIAQHKIDLGLGNINAMYYIKENQVKSEKKLVKINKIQLECMFLALAKVLKRKMTESLKKLAVLTKYPKKRVEDKENLPRKLNKNELAELERRKMGVFEEIKPKNGEHEIENIIFCGNKEENKDKNERKQSRFDEKNSYFEINRQRKKQKTNEKQEKTINLNYSVQELAIEKGNFYPNYYK